MSVGRCARKCRQLENLLGGGDGGGRARRAVPHISGGQNLVATNAVCSAVACECAPRSPPSRFIQCPRRRSALYSRSGASHKSLGALKFVVGRPRARRTDDPGERRIAPQSCATLPQHASISTTSSSSSPTSVPPGNDRRISKPALYFLLDKRQIFMHLQFIHKSTPTLMRINHSRSVACHVSRVNYISASSPPAARYKRLRNWTADRTRPPMRQCSSR